jgi:membrane-bound lytic murein transglycosylase D
VLINRTNRNISGALVALCLSGGLSGCRSAPAELSEVQPAPVIVPYVEVRATHRPIAPPAEPAPPPSFWDLVRTDFALDYDERDPRFIAATKWVKRHDVAPRLLAKGEPYLMFLYREIKARDLPTELMLLPMVESAMDPYAFSPGGAAGLWQLIPATARRYQVKLDWWYDGRRDPIDSTRAALDYLEFLYGRFDDWLLAVAAYNSGEGRVARALKRQPGADFWQLKLPKETEVYVPRLLALAHTIDNAEHSGLEMPDITREPSFVPLEVVDQINLIKLAELTGVPVEDLYRLNPGLNRSATPPQGPHRVLVPADEAKAFATAIADYPRDGVRWERHRIRSGDSLITLSKRYETTVAAIREANNVSGHMIRAGDTLLIPAGSNAAQRVPANPLLARPGTAPYTVSSGDSLWTIARRFGTSTDALVRTNRLDPRRPIKVGQRLQVPTKGSARRLSYRVRRGDSLAAIASKFGVRIGDIVRWNSLDSKAYLQPGQRLTLVVDVMEVSEA